jgi:hypothetical protein
MKRYNRKRLSHSFLLHNWVIMGSSFGRQVEE